MRTFPAPAPSIVQDAAFADAQRAFMTRVYGWMFVGLGLTAITALVVASSQALFVPVMRAFLPLVLAELGLVFALSFLASRLSAAVAGAMFLAYSVLNGLTLSAIFYVYELGSITSAFGITAGVFGAMTLYATVTKKDLSSWGSFLFMGLLGVVVASVVNIFLQNDLMAFVVSCASVVVFTGLTAYDTHKLRNFFAASWVAGGGVGSLAVIGALELYLDFINLFLAILRLLGRRR